MPTRFSKKFWTALAIFGLMGQVAWVVENMYFNVFIYKIFHASAADILRIYDAPSSEEIVDYLMKNGHVVSDISKNKVGLEEYYIELMSKKEGK